jgi:homoserine O-acetyltransferase/O-succinyltransferase
MRALTNFWLMCFSSLLVTSQIFAQEIPQPTEGDYLTKNFHFRSGEALPEMKLHYRTYGEPVRNAGGQVTNAVLIMHGTTGSGRQFVGKNFAGVLFGSGQLLDAGRYYIILPDAIGHGGSSKPSDGLHAKFPQYDYDDMVAAQHLLLTEGLKVDHLRLVMGTSMGCMHTWVWVETHRDFADAAMPLACLPVQIAGRNRVWRKTIIDALRDDPGYMNGEYKQQPAVMRTVIGMLLLMATGVQEFQRENPTREKADEALKHYVDSGIAHDDANDFIYAFDASRNYDPSPRLDQITIPVMFVNSADDAINPPELGIAEQEIKKVKNGHFVLIPASEQTRGHGTHSLPAVWKQYLEELLKESEPAHAVQ